MKYQLTILFCLLCIAGQSQKRNVLTPDSTIAIPKLVFDSAGILQITSSVSSSPADFDFLLGKWVMHHRRLNKRLEHCTDWTAFTSTDENHKILSGTVDVDTYSTTEMPGLEGKLFEGFTMRLFNPLTRLWSLYWVASNTGVLDPPVVGSFDKQIGHFFTKDNYHGKPVIVLFRWDVRDREHPVWSQAFSPDNGKTWEWNWFNVSERVR